MKKHIFTVIIIIFLSCLSSCEKDTQTGCRVGKFATLKIVNTSKNPYDIYNSNSSMGVLTGNSSRDYKVFVGNNTLSAVQKSGYVLYPTKVSKTINVIACENEYWTIP
jgi:hypothetical protein